MDPLSLRPSYEDKFLIYWGRSGDIERAFPEFGKQVANAPTEFKRHDIQQRLRPFYARRLSTMVDSISNVLFATLIDADASEYDFTRGGYCVIGAGFVEASRIDQSREGENVNMAELVGGPEVMYEAEPNGRRDSPQPWLNGLRGPVQVQFRNWIPDCDNGRGTGGVFVLMKPDIAERLDLNRFVANRRLFLQLFWRPIMGSGDAARVHAHLVAYRVISRTGASPPIPVASLQVVGR